MKSFTIGYSDGRAVKVPISIVTQTVALLARKDGGKTYTGMLLAENLLDAGAQVIVIDVVGKWWALRLGKNGRSRGKNIAVLGGKKGDEALAPEAGALVAQAVVKTRLSVVLDLTFMRPAKRRRFLADFAEEFLHLKQVQEPTTPVHIIIEEAQESIPQFTEHAGPDENRMKGAFVDIVCVGRNAGIGVTMISQRPQAVAKSALSQTELLIALGVNEVPARKAIEGWVQEKGANREIIGELPGLAQGEAIMWSPSWLRFFGRVKIAKRTTYDSTATVKLGRRRAVGKLPKSNQKQLRAAFEQATKLAERDDPTALKRRVVELEIELKKKEKFIGEVDVRTKHIDEKVDKIRAMKPQVRVVLPKRAIRRIEKAAKTFEKAAARAQHAVKNVVVATGGLDGMYKMLQASAQIVRAAVTPVVASPAVTVRQLKRPIPVKRADTINATFTRKNGAEPTLQLTVEGLNEYATEILKTIASRHPMSLTTSQIALLAGRSPRSSAFSGAMAKIRAAGLLTETERGRYVLSPDGRAQVGAVDPPRDPAELREHWLRVLDEYPRDLLKAGIERHPQAVTREELAEITHKSIKSSAFSGAISTLVKNELFEVPSPGSVRVSDTLF